MVTGKHVYLSQETQKVHDYIRKCKEEFLLGIPGKHFITKDMKEYFHEVIGVDPMKYLTYSSIEDFGYCGGATMLIQLDRLARASVLGKGDIVAAYLEESSKWMSGGFIVSQH